MDLATLGIAVPRPDTGPATKALTDLGSKGGAVARDIQSAFAAVAAYLSGHALIGAFHAIAEATSKAELAQARLTGVLRATGDAAGFTAERLEAIATSMSRHSLFDDESIKNAAAQLAIFGNVTGDVFERALRAGADFATLTGTDISSAVQTLGKALEDPIAGMTKLQRAGIALSAAEHLAVSAAIRHNDVRAAQTVILDALESKIGGLAGAAHSGLTGSLHDLSLEWENFLETLGQTPGIAQTVANAIALVADSIQGLILTLAPTRAMLEESLREEQSRRVQSLETFSQRTGPTNVAIGAMSQQDYLAEVQRQSDALVSITARIDGLRTAAYGAMQESGAAASNAAAQVLTVVHGVTDAHKQLARSHKDAMDMFVQSLQNQATAQQQVQEQGRTAAEKIIAAERSKADAVEATNAKILAQNKALLRLKNDVKSTDRANAGGGGAKGENLGDVAGGLVIGQGVGFAMGLASGVVSHAIDFVAGGFSDLAKSIFGAGDAAAKAAEEFYRLSRAFKVDLASFSRRALGTDTDLNRGLDQAHAEADALIAQAKASGTWTRDTEAWIRNLERQYTDRLNAEDRAQREKEAADQARTARRGMEDLGVRLLSATGGNADDLAFQLRQERELEDARLANADAAYLEQLRTVQLAEAHARAAAKIQNTIDSLTNTISTLQSFKNALLLDRNLSTLSPVQQLAETRRQYEATLAAARGGDQAQAAMLPGAAQAFLEASRAANASSMAYVADFNRVRSDTEEVLKLFEAQRTDAQKTLDQLGSLNETNLLQLEAQEQTGEILLAGFKQLVAEQQASRSQMDDLFGRLGRKLDAAALN